jgi:1-acyl-sn-glycerol-3-phosphate acyltransferase
MNEVLLQSGTKENTVAPGPRRRVSRRWSFAWLCSYARSLLYFIPLIFLATGVYGLLSLAVSALDNTGRRQHAIAQRWARALLRITRLHVVVKGRENLITHGPCVLVANHLSYMDTPVIFAELPMQFRILARRWLFRIPCLGWHLRRSMHLPIADDVRSSLRSVLKAADHVRRGLPLFVFPEGGRSSDGHLQNFFAGAFFLAIRARVPVVPMVLTGTREALAPGSLHIRPRTASLVICRPIETEQLSSRDVEQLSGRVKAEIAEVLKANEAIV